jgi:hypothetical protein
MTLRNSSHRSERWVLALAAGLIMPLAIACGSDGAPLQTLDSWPEGCGENPYGGEAPEHVALANDIMAAESDEPVFDKEERDRLASEVERILFLVREALPPDTRVYPPPYFIPQVSLGLRGPAAARWIDAARDTPYSLDLYARESGDPEIDETAEGLGLRAGRFGVDSDRDTVSASLCLSDAANAARAAEMLRALDHVEYAEAQSWMSIDWIPGINMRKYGEDWYVVTVAREQRCTLGCGSVRSYFKVTEGVLQELPAEEAVRDARFRHVERLAEWGMSH